MSNENSIHVASVDVLHDVIKGWLREDVGSGDVTTWATIPVEHDSEGVLHSKEDGIIAGLNVAELVFAVVDQDVRFRMNVQDGTAVKKGDVVARVEGRTRSILTAERLALNLLQRMSGIATKTRQFVEATAGLPVRVVDTRKTTPGHRMLEKYAVRVGGGANHRFGLYDAVMIKDNHIKASGSIRQAIERARAAIPHTMKIEVEIEHMEQLDEALQAGADIIMLDNMSNDLMRRCVAAIRAAAPHVTIEASGGVRLDTIRAMAETGVDVISVGGLTHSVQALDISLDLYGKKEARL